MTNIEFIRANVPRKALWDQLGEELAELIQALYKLRRAKGNGNPTPVTVDEAMDAVQEEIYDVVNCCNVIGIPFMIGEEETDEDTVRYIQFCIGSSLVSLSVNRKTSIDANISYALGWCKALGYNIDFDPESQKLRRWVERIREVQNG